MDKPAEEDSEFEAELRAEYGMTLAEYDRLLDEYKDEGFSTRIKPFYGTKR